MIDVYAGDVSKSLRERFLCRCKLARAGVAAINGPATTALAFLMVFAVSVSPGGDM